MRRLPYIRSSTSKEQNNRHSCKCGTWIFKFLACPKNRASQNKIIYKNLKIILDFCEKRDIILLLSNSQHNLILGNCVTVARQTPTLFVGVRIPIPQPKRKSYRLLSMGFLFCIIHFSLFNIHHSFSRIFNEY